MIEGAAVADHHLRVIVALDHESMLVHLTAVLSVLLVLAAGLGLEQPVRPHRLAVLLLRQRAVRGDLEQGEEVGEGSDFHNAIRGGIKSSRRVGLRTALYINSVVPANVL